MQNAAVVWPAFITFGIERYHPFGGFNGRQVIPQHTIQYGCERIEGMTTGIDAAIGFGKFPYVFLECFDGAEGFRAGLSGDW